MSDDDRPAPAPDPAQKLNWRRAWAEAPVSMFMATFAGIGHIPGGPGTYAAILFTPLIVLMSALPIWLRVVLWLAASLAAIAWSEKACRALREPDSRRIVLDEVIGVWTALVWFDDLGWPAALVGLVAFRVLDILKPPPADRLHKHGEGGLSVVLDDIIAGLWSVPLVILVRWLVG